MNPENVVGAPSQPGQPVASVAPAKPVASEPVTPVAEPVKKSSKGGIIAAILFAVIAVGGVGFGVWAMLDGNSQRDVLNTQIEALKKTNSELLEQVAENGSSSDIDTEDYIYVGDWGLKIKIPDELNMVSYELKYGDVNQSSLCISGVAGEVDVLPDFANIYKNYPGLGCVSRSANIETQLCTIVFSEGGYDYCVSRSNAPFSDNDIDLENSSIELIQTTLLDKNNYSNI